MDALIAFLRARLGEDEQVARAATAGPWTVDGRQHAEAIHGVGHRPVIAAGQGDDAAPVFESPADAVHMARHNPARVLREVMVKQQLLNASNAACTADCAAEHAFGRSCALRWMGPLHEDGNGRWLYDDTGARHTPPPVTTPWTLRLLALPYADHPDYRSEWGAADFA